LELTQQNEGPWNFEEIKKTARGYRFSPKARGFGMEIACKTELVPKMGIEILFFSMLGQAIAEESTKFER
jgi:hypothetical protein